jgi:hypothetical protein
VKKEEWTAPIWGNHEVEVKVECNKNPLRPMSIRKTKIGTNLIETEKLDFVDDAEILAVVKSGIGTMKNGRWYNNVGLSDEGIERLYKLIKKYRKQTKS